MWGCGGVGVEDCGHKTSMQSKRYLDLVTFWQVIFVFFILSHISVLKHREQIEQNIFNLKLKKVNLFY